ncbi:non-ribosomal peptide synthetase [Aestuariispira ectoiniformans]|uniref:non-ribosomal peptide synthetase n=1 Tax=Aestuariispira ectoiniformans TaxID=2775080 RepID=UPI00223B4D5A|nr:amino acid adenylation domain-containing protein [Aestuariispira ectoiniformans]
MECQKGVEDVSVMLGPAMETGIRSSCFEAIVDSIERHPDNIALIGGGDTVTYRQLGFLAAKQAKRILEAGSQEGQLIPIVTDGGAHMIISMLAVWAAGAAFVPADINAPEVRLADILEQTDSRIVIADKTMAIFAGRVVLDTVVAIEDPAELAQRSLVQTSMPRGGQLAYGFFTSGSTGKPKCCLNIHSGLWNRACAMSDNFTLSPGEAVLQNSSHVFDSSLWQIFWPLTCGATVVVPSRSSAQDIHATLDELHRHRVVMTDFVPSILELILRAMRQDKGLAGKLEHMRYLLVGGEAVNTRLVADVSELLPHIQLVNTYGPTEASIGMVFHFFQKEEYERIPLGQPINNTFLAVVDEQFRCVPIGSRGEIVIGGACLGAGYLNDEVRTNASFMTNPGLPVPGERIYRTGDIGEVAKDGLLYFHGRSDDQVKIAGVRIELGEVEAAINCFPGVQLVKVVHGNRNGRSWLAAFFSAVSEIDISKLQGHLQENLNKPAIPSVLLQIDEFPRTASGKIDGKKLVQQLEEDRNTEQESQSQADIVQALCQQQCLQNISSKGQNLMDCGIDSLGVLNLSLDLQKEFGRSISLEWLYDNLCVRDITARLDKSAGEAIESESLSVESRSPHSDLLLHSADIVVPERSEDMSKPDAIFMTGATGYVGANFLEAISRTTDRPIICLVRAENDPAALDRLQQIVSGKYKLTVDWGKVTALAGDLCNLTSDLLEVIKSKGVRQIIHAAADVNFLKNYTSLYKCNVEVTAKLCNLACSGPFSRFHYISSMSVAGFDGVQDASQVSGYSASKWTAENIVRKYAEHGLPSTIYRLGEMMPDQYSRIPNEAAALSSFIRAALKLKVAPDIGLMFDYTPISVVAGFVAENVAQNNINHVLSVENLFHPEKLDMKDVVEVASLRAQLEVVGKNEFKKRLNAAMGASGQGVDRDIARASMMLDIENDLFSGDDEVPVASDFSSAGLNWPSISEELLKDWTSGFRGS